MRDVLHREKKGTWAVRQLAAQPDCRGKGKRADRAQADRASSGFNVARIWGSGACRCSHSHSCHSRSLLGISQPARRLSPVQSGSLELSAAATPH